MKRKFLLGVLGIMMLLLPACSASNDKKGEAPEIQSIETQNIDGNTTDTGEPGDERTGDGASSSAAGDGEGNTADGAAAGGTSSMEPKTESGMGAETEKGNAGGSGEGITAASEASSAETGNTQGDGTANTGGNTPMAGAGTEGQPSGTDGAQDGYREIYGQILTEETGNTTVYSLAYVDSDDVPELIICDRGYGTYSIYTIKDGEAFCMMDSVTTVELTYFERNGIVALFARWIGGGDEGGYGWYYYQVTKDKTLTDGDMPVLRYSYEAIYDEEGNWEEEGVSKYYHMEQEVDEATYQEMASSLGIAEDNARTCGDNALGKKEMMEFLGQ